MATFNQRAIKLYRKVGFKDAETIMQDTNGILVLITLFQVKWCYSQVGAKSF